MPDHIINGNQPANPAAAVNNAANQMADSIATVAGNWANGVSTYGLPEGARASLKEASSQIINAVAVISASRDEAARWRTNLDLAESGREARSQDALAKGREAATESLDKAQILADVGEMLLIDASSPDWGDTFTKQQGNMTQAKHDFRMAIDSADGMELIDRLSSLAESDSHLSALATDSAFMDLYLMGRGKKASDRKLIINAVREKAIHARAARGSQPARLALEMRKTIRGTLGSAKALANHRF